jgi:PleD family two-component response regulator
MAMLVGIGVGDAVAIIDRLRDQIAAADFGLPGLSVTFSAGLVQLCPDETLERAIERADQEMYRAKSTGRDRTCTPVAALQPQLDIFTG